MAFKGTAGKSSSGASMSKYDVEVESRLKKLESAVSSLAKAVDECKTSCESHSHGNTGGGGKEAEIIASLKTHFPVKFANL